MFRTSGFKHCEKAGCIRRNGKEEQKKRKNDWSWAHNMQVRTRSKYSLSISGYLCQNAYYGLLQNPVTRRVVLTLFLCFFLLAVIIINISLLLSISLLTLLMSIVILSSYKIVEENTRSYCIIVPSFYVSLFFFTKFRTCLYYIIGDEH